MSILFALKRTLAFIVLILAPVAFATQVCVPFLKQVSVDGGATWFDADDGSAIPEQVIGGDIEYRFVVTNCEADKVCFNTTIEDAILGIPVTPVPDPQDDDTIQPGEQVFVTKVDAGFENLAQTCDVPGNKRNVATETTTIVRNASHPDDFERFDDEANVLCVAPPVASLGDRVWHDLNGDGAQNCNDDNANLILGDFGDSGDECGTGISGLQVDLLMPGPDGCDSTNATVLFTTTTDADGFYRFDDLDADLTYCVGFTKPPADFCRVDNINLGNPLFTSQNAGDDVKDSDADPVSGRTGAIDLSAGQQDLSIDAGIVCPVKIGNRVWEDLNGDGVQDPGEADIAGVTAQLLTCGNDMQVGGGDDLLVAAATTDADGMYMFGGQPGMALPPNKYYVLFDSTTYPDGYARTVNGVGPDDVDSDCGAPNGATACTDLTASGTINLDRDCGLVPPAPNCELVLDKSCRIEAPPSASFDKCSGKLQQFTLVWNGAGPITATGPNNSADLDTGDEVTFLGPFSNNDVLVNISGAVSGQSKFHTSCSDDDFNDPSDCGKMAGNGKGDENGLINDWILEGFIDADGRVLDCNPTSDGGFADNCSYVTPPQPSCETMDKPDELTWRFDGGSGSCAASTFGIQDDFECSGSVNVATQVTVTPDSGPSILVNPGEEFTISRDASKEILLSNIGGDQGIVLHTSCSQPIEAGLTAGALTLVALDGQTGGVDVTYRYLVTNTGDPLSGVTVIDNLLGDVGGPIPLGSGDSAMFDVKSRIFGTTTNVGSASGMLANGVCMPDSASDSVTVTANEPTCDVSIALYKIEDKKIKWKLSSAGGIDATIKSLTVSWPGGERLKKVKFDGNDILKDDLRSSPATVLEGEWLKEVKDRTLEADESGKKLEIEFTDDFPFKDDQPASDFTLEVEFAQGCSVSY